MEMKKGAFALLAMTALLSACSDDDDDDNSMPVASDVSIGSFNYSTSITIPSSAILAGASDSDGDTLTIESLEVASASGSLAASGSDWTYTPANNEIGTVSFNYTVTDGSFTASASASLTIVDASKAVISDNGSVLVTGVLRDAVSREFLSGLDVTMFVNGNEYTVKSAAGTGAATFLNVPVDSEYFVTVTDPNGMYATEYYSDTTPDYNTDVDGNLIIEDLVQQADIGEMYKAVTTTVTISDVTTGNPVTGLTLYVDSTELAEINGNPVSISGPDLLATETAGSYSIKLPDNDMSYSILVRSLVDSNGVEFEAFRATITNNLLTKVMPGTSTQYYMTAVDNSKFTIIYHLVDEDGQAYDAGGVISVTNLTTGGTEFWSKLPNTTNEYFFEVTSANMMHSRRINPIDEDNDLFDDYIASISDSALGVQNPVTRGSFDDNNTLLLVQPLQKVNYDEALQAEIISSDDNFQVNGTAEIIIAFDRPVELSHTPRMSYDMLKEEEVLISLNNPALMYQEDMMTLAVSSSAAAESNSVLNGDNEYEYTDKDDQVVTLDLGRGDTSQVLSTYASNWQFENMSRSLVTSEYALSANNSILTITLDSSTLMADHNYRFEFAVKGLLDQNPAAFLSFTKKAKTNAATSLDDLIVDNFDFADTTMFNPADPSVDLTFSDQKDHTDKFRALNVGYVGGAASDVVQLKYLNYTSSGLSIMSAFNGFAGVNSSQNSLYLVSAAPISGTVRIINQTEADFIDDAAVEEVVSLPNQFYRIGLPLQNINDDGDLTQLTNISQLTGYIFNKPQNHGLNANGINQIYGASSVSGSSITSEGIYYIYALPLSVQTSGHIKRVTLEFDVEANGAAVKGSKEYTVQ